MTEGTVLSLLGAALGLALAFWGLKALLAANPGKRAARVGDHARPGRPGVHGRRRAADRTRVRPGAAAAHGRPGGQPVDQGRRAARDVGRGAKSRATRARRGRDRAGGHARDRRRAAHPDVQEPDECRCRIRRGESRHVRARAAAGDVSRIRSASCRSSPTSRADSTTSRASSASPACRDCRRTVRSTPTTRTSRATRRARAIRPPTSTTTRSTTLGYFETMGIDIVAGPRRSRPATRSAARW